MKEAVFLDRDGVIIESRDDHIKSWEEVAFLPGALPALARLVLAGKFIVMVTNQGVVGRGIISLDQAQTINRKILDAVASGGGRIDAAYICPHHPDDGCDCRKPKPGMLLAAAREHGLDLTHSHLVGDAVADIEAARAAGVRGIMVLSGRGRRQAQDLKSRPELQCQVVDDLEKAVGCILSNERSEQ